MSSGGSLGRRYAKALLAIGRESGKVEAIGNELKSLREAFETSAELRGIFENPDVSSEQRRRVIQAIALKMGVSPTVTNTMLMLADRRRMRYLPEIESAYNVLAEAASGRVQAEVVTATPMPPAYYDELQAVLEKVTGKKVTLVKRQDPSLIAGVVARVGDLVFDGSVRNRLVELKDTLLSR